MRGRGRVNRESNATGSRPQAVELRMRTQVASIGAGPARLLLASRVAARPPAENYVGLPLS